MQIGLVASPSYADVKQASELTRSVSDSEYFRFFKDVFGQHTRYMRFGEDCPARAAGSSARPAESSPKAACFAGCGSGLDREGTRKVEESLPARVRHEGGRFPRGIRPSSSKTKRPGSIRLRVPRSNLLQRSTETARA